MGAVKLTDAVRREMHELFRGGRTRVDIAAKFGTSTTTVGRIVDNSFDQCLQRFNRAYTIQPLDLIDTIIRERGATARRISDALGFAYNSTSYRQTHSTLKQLCDDGILKRTKESGKVYKYVINSHHPQAYLLKAMCRVIE